MDKQLCNAFGYFLANYLTVSELVEYSYIGFESRSFCSNVVDHVAWMEPGFTNPVFICELSDTGHYTPVCRGWYKL